jgi:hypothetical protein
VAKKSSKVSKGKPAPAMRPQSGNANAGKQRTDYGKRK